MKGRSLLLGAVSLSLVVQPMRVDGVRVGQVGTYGGREGPVLRSSSVGSSPPQPEGLIARAQAVLRARKSYHVQATETIVAHKRRRVVWNAFTRGSADISIRPRRERERVSITSRKEGQSTHTELDEIRIVGNRGASRSSPTAPWGCGNARNPYDGLFVPAISVGSGRVHVTARQNLGKASVDGVSTWDVRERGFAMLAVFREDVMLDVYIGRATGALVRQVLVLWDRDTDGTRSRSTIVDDYSSYGRAVHVALPAVCQHRRGH